ncbi:putative transcription factor [Cinnamomum micranthum f. kanehirae]|uniref:Putative transcription factor n=1 Tax=Cinnamomum micranthum f. kanehirae TaxID=337451 RepID=A0A3S4NNP2_9MAGN|nr:putative transcription factor [Cinnamomum micranthum f. kanehirae]
MATPHQPHHLHHIPIKAAARKLPIKRKNPEPDFSPNPNFFVKPETPSSSSDPLVAEDDDGEEEGEEDLKPPPFKFHRIWQESDEIRFLQGLLDSSAHGFVFPRDLNPFFDRFSKSMAQPYTRSQLSEKLRRLKKKFRVISARLDRGLDAALLTPHDRALLHLSKQLWHPAFAASSPFSSSGKKKSGISVSSPIPTPRPPPCTNGGHNFNGEGGFSHSSGGGGLGRGVAKAVMDVFDQSLQEMRVALAHGGILFDHAAAPGPDQGKARDLARKWQEHKVAELDVLASRLSRSKLEREIHPPINEEEIITSNSSNH